MRRGFLALLVVAVVLLYATRSFWAVRFKSGVNLSLAPEMARALPLVELAHQDAGISRGAVITSGAEGEHRPDSLHFATDALGQPAAKAIDLRTRDLTAAQLTRLELALRVRLNGKARLNRPYQVVREVKPPHLHVEYQPA